VAILRRHLLDKVPVSDLCEELGQRPTVFLRWQKEFFENGAAAFQSRERPRRQAEERQKRIELLEKKVHSKEEVLAELMAEVSRSAPEGNRNNVEKGNPGEGGSSLADAADLKDCGPSWQGSSFQPLLQLAQMRPHCSSGLVGLVRP
jgi:hypothetical protein